MVNPSDFCSELSSRGIEFYAGVPDSLLKEFCKYLELNAKKENHTITANEGNAVGLAIGYHLATGKIPLVYMQNSGEGNIVNPFASLADKEVYGIPILFLIGWRGEPGVHDEPQHIKQGRITLSLLDTLEIPYSILENNPNKIKSDLDKAIIYMKQQSAPYAIIARKDLFDKIETAKQEDNSKYQLTRESALEFVLKQAEKDALIVSTTGMLSRELFELREKYKETMHEKDFLTVGGMGHTSSIALGVAMSKPSRQVYCFDGDGSFIMHLGASAIIGQKKPENLRHIIFNNGAHDSVGGQPTAGFSINMRDIAKACGYNSALYADDENGIREAFEVMRLVKGPVLLEIRVKKGNRKELGRPTTTPKQNKEAFMNNLSSDNLDKNNLNSQ